IGSQQSTAADAPQHELPPVVTRKAAWPYFSFTISLISILSSFTDLDDCPWLNRLVSCAALGIQKRQDLLQRFGIGRIPEKGAVPPDAGEVFAAELFQMMGQRGVGDSQFHLDIRSEEHTSELQS